MPPAARLGDLHVCPMVIPGTPPIPHVGGPITMGSANVIIGGSLAARVGDMCLCPPVGPTDSIVKGSVTVTINGMPAARIGDTCSHGGMIVIGCPTVIIGDNASGGGAASGGAGTPGAPATPPDAVEPMVSPLMRGAAMSAAKTQKAALKAASKTGVPFCAVCQKT